VIVGCEHKAEIEKEFGMMLLHGTDGSHG
jgi:hypothetical protein